MRLLLVEDDPELLNQLKQNLERAGFTIDTSQEGVEGEFLGDTGSYDAVVLDLGLPGRPGLEVLANWRGRSNDVPVLILTARGAWHEKVEGFNTGADDYLAKPFHTEELIARLQALIRRRHGMPGGILSVGNLALDGERRSVTISGNDTVNLTATEYRLLEYLMLNAGTVISKSRLLEHTYSESDADENLIEVYINRLRRKLGKEFIETRRGQGYVLRGTN